MLLSVDQMYHGDLAASEARTYREKHRALKKIQGVIDKRQQVSILACDLVWTSVAHAEANDHPFFEQERLVSARTF